MASAGGKVEETSTGSTLGAAATPEHVALCFDALLAHFKGESPPKEAFDTSVKHPLFVTWKKYSARHKDYDLRGCIGYLSPIPLSKLKQYALTSALKDHRFPPMQPEEMKHLHCGVSLLVNYEEGKAWNDFEIGKHGIIIEFGFTNGDHYNATYLPEVAKEQGWDHKQTIDTLIRKAGYRGKITSQLRDAISLTRYQSSKAGLTYDEWRAMRGHSKHPI